MMQRNGYLQDNTAISIIYDLLSSYVTKIRPILGISALSGTTYSTYLASFQTLHSAIWTGNPLFCHHEFKKKFQRSIVGVLYGYLQPYYRYNFKLFNLIFVNIQKVELKIRTITKHLTCSFIHLQSCINTNYITFM